VELELVVVDDNSPDGTGTLADDLATRHRMRVIHRSGKLGLGTAVMAGVAAAAADVVAVMDADLSHPPSILPKLWAVCSATGADVVVASRYIPGGRTANWPFKRRALSRLGGLFARPLTPLRDPGSGFFLIRRALAQAVEIKAGGFKIGLELVVRSGSRRLVEIPYHFEDRQRGESKMSTREAFGYLVQLVDLYRFSWTRARPGTDYVALSAADVDAILAGRRQPSVARDSD
jgi:dolichol-phosphate mannosyltransferase